MGKTVDNFNADCKIEETFPSRRGEASAGRGSSRLVSGAGFEPTILFVVLRKVPAFEEKKVTEVLGFGTDVSLGVTLSKDCTCFCVVLKS